jgi:hypothetical protein
MISLAWKENILRLGRAACEDLQIGGQPNLTGDFVHNAQDVASDVLHPIGRQAVVNELADVDVFTQSADAQEGRIIVAKVFLVDIAQRFEMRLEAVVRFETNEDWLVDQKVKQRILLPMKFPLRPR